MPNEQRAAYVRRRWGKGIEKTLPKGGATDENIGKYFAEVTLDVSEEANFLRRATGEDREVGPRHVHLRTNAMGEITMPPHLVENMPGEYFCQKWTDHPKIDRNMFILDRTFEDTERQLRALVTQRDVPVLTADSLAKIPSRKFGSFRSKILNAPKKEPFPTASPLDLPWLE